MSNRAGHGCSPRRCSDWPWCHRLPAGADPAAAACAWQGTAWELPAEANGGTLEGYSGDRYAVGATGRYVPFTGMVDPRGTLWDNGRVVLRAVAATPRYRDVNPSGLVVGHDVVGGELVAVTIGRDGRAAAPAGDPAWDGYSAELVTDAGDVVGYADTGSQDVVVVWPASAPGTYRALPSPGVGYLHPVDVDRQGRVVALTGTGSGGGLVWDGGRWHVLAARGTGGYSTPRAIRDGAVVDRLTAVPWTYSLRWISDDETTLVGSDGGRPVQYRCS